ncbi:HAD-IA family hydrolase [Cellulosimicrobium terreum]|nr:HAD-IA family hydrolase [Cellulosimicrobium terreum]
MWEWSGSGLLLDLDGTLVDSAAAIERHTTWWAQRLGLDPATVIEASHGRRDAEIVPLVAPWADTAAEVAWLHTLSCDDTSDVVAVPGAADLLAALAPEAWVVVTSAAHDVALARLDAAGLPRPRFLVCSEDVLHGKPDPEGFLRGAALLGLDPRSCLALEDSDAGVSAAVRAGASVVSVGPSPVPGADCGVVDLAAVTVEPDGDLTRVRVLRGAGAASAGPALTAAVGRP